MVEKSCKIGLAVLIQYRRVTDRHPATGSQPATQPRRRSIYRAYYVARVKKQAVTSHKQYHYSNCAMHQRTAELFSRIHKISSNYIFRLY